MKSKKALRKELKQLEHLVRGTTIEVIHNTETIVNLSLYDLAIVARFGKYNKSDVLSIDAPYSTEGTRILLTGTRNGDT